MTVAIILLEATLLFSPFLSSNSFGVQPIGRNTWFSDSFTRQSFYVVDFDPGFHTDPQVNPFQTNYTLTQDGINFDVHLAVYQPQLNSSYKAALIISCDSITDPVLSLQPNVSGPGRLQQIIGTKGGHFPEWIQLEFDSQDHSGYNSSAFRLGVGMGFRGFAGEVTLTNTSQDLSLNAQGFPYVMTNWGHRIVVIYAFDETIPASLSFTIRLVTRTVFQQSHLILNVSEEVSW